MTGIEKIAKGQRIPEKDEFLDALRRDICQILEFDFGFIDLVNGAEFGNALSFCELTREAEIRETVSSLQDDEGQPLSNSNSNHAQSVRQSLKPWVGKAYTNKASSSDRQSKLSSLGQDCYPYAIVPIVAGSAHGPHTLKGLLRIVSLDALRELSDQDLSTLRLIGEHLSSRVAQLSIGPTSEQLKEPIGNENVLIVHNNRPIRRRFSRILGSVFKVVEADGVEKALEQLNQNSFDLVILDNEVKDSAGEPLSRVLKESPQWTNIPIILVTPDTNPTARIEGLNMGADDCLSESCFDPELLARSRSLIRHRKSERELAVQLQLLEDYAKRLEKATEKLSTDTESQLQRNQELKLARWESEVLRMQDTLIHRISNTIRRSFNIQQNLTDMLEELAGWLNLDCCFVVMPTPDEPEDSIRCEYANKEDYSVKEFDLDLKVLEVFQRNYEPEKLLIINDATTDPNLEHYRQEALSRLHILSIFFIPITYEEKLLGLLVGFKCESEGNWTGDNQTFLKSVADQVATGVTNARLYARVQRQATTDGLTGLFNHRTGQEKLSEQLRLAERYQRNLAVLMIDVDHFKSINDNYGHPTGDTVLKAVAKLIQRDCRDVDLPVRYGGEEFLLVLPEVNTEGAMIVAERIRKTLAQTAIHHEGIEITVTASMGVAGFPENAQSQQQLLDLADKALYLSKRLGRNQVHTASDLLFEEPAAEPASAPKSSSEVAKELQAQSTFVPPTVPQAAQDKEELVPEVVEMVKALASTLYSKSDYNKVHHLETARISELLARVMGLSQQQVEQIRVAGLLHDVGTLSIPAEMMTKQGVYTAEERQIMNQHPLLGAELLRPIRALRDICEILENHHERWDGTGYPHGLKGEQIPLPARILSIVDSYHALISDRPYRKALTPEDAVRTLREGAGLQWDPFLVDIFITVLTNLKKNQDPLSAANQQPSQ